MLINISGDKSEISVQFNEPISVKDSSRIALTGASIWYSWYNFIENTIRYRANNDDWIGDWIIIKFPDGMYDDSDIISFLEEYFNGEAMPFSLKVSHTMSKFILDLKPGYSVDFMNTSEILGFMKSYTNNTHNNKEFIAENIPNITRGVDRILIHCSIVDDSFTSTDRGVFVKSDVIYSFIPNVDTGSLINIQPNKPKYLAINTDSIRNIKMKITDQDNRPIDLNGEKVSYELEIVT